MAITTQTIIPASFTAGDTVLWTESHADYPASTWALRYFFRREGRRPVEVEGVASSDAFTFTLTAEASGEFDDGRWRWFSRASKQDEGSISVDSGTILVYPDPSAQHSPSFSEQALEMVEASIRGDLPTAQESISIAGADINLMSISERFVLRDKIKAEIARERQARRLSSGYNRKGLQVRFI